MDRPELMGAEGVTNPGARAFNARWLTPTEVAERFVPVPAFQRLVATSHAVLLGPRGSGKTTLLKMLTRRALTAWADVLDADSELAQELDLPSFEAVYLPSDVRWSIELGALDREPILSPEGAQLLQRYLVTASSVQAVASTLASLCVDDPKTESAVVADFVSSWPLRSNPSTLSQLALVMRSAANQVRGVVNRRRPSEIAELIERLPEAWVGHPLDIPIALCEVFSHLAGARVRGERWALCFDELEIAPDWLRTDLLNAFRSVEQPYLLKLTWTPVLPQEALGSAAMGQDFRQIKLWHSHAHEARAFAGRLTARFVRSNFGSAATPEDVFGPGRVHERSSDDVAHEPKYERGSVEYRDFKKLADDDPSFARLLARRGVDPRDPVAEDADVRDSLLRKVRPLVIVRLAFLAAGGRQRSRKVVPEVYSGVEVLYDTCEGNPRWLLGLLADLYDAWRESGSPRPKVDRSKQARVVRAFAERFHDELAARTVRPTDGDARLGWSLGDLADRIGEALSEGLLGPSFPVDPVGTFRVGPNHSPQIMKLVDLGLDAGAFVYVGGATKDAPVSLEGSRLRLSYRLASLYHLPPRSFRDVSLSELLSRGDPSQVGLFEEGAY